MYVYIYTEDTRGARRFISYRMPGSLSFRGSSLLAFVINSLFVGTMRGTRIFVRRSSRALEKRLNIFFFLRVLDFLRSRMSDEVMKNCGFLAKPRVE